MFRWNCQRHPLSVARCRLLLAVGLCGSLLGCVTVYYPLSGLHRPVALDLDYANFPDLTIRLHCVPGPLADRDESNVLCRKLGNLFESQGARVTIDGIGQDPDQQTPQSAPEAAAALTIRLSSRLLHEDTTSYLFFQRRTGYTLSQEVSIVDDNGFLLIRDQLTGRFDHRLGFSSNEAEFSADFYRQMAQLTLNAQLRRKVLREATQQQAELR